MNKDNKQEIAFYAFFLNVQKSLPAYFWANGTLWNNFHNDSSTQTFIHKCEEDNNLPFVKHNTSIIWDSFTLIQVIVWT